MRGAWLPLVLAAGCGTGLVDGIPDAEAPEPPTVPRPDVDEIEDDVAGLREDVRTVTDVPAPQGDIIAVRPDAGSSALDVVTPPPVDVVIPTPDVPTARPDVPAALPEMRCTLRATNFDGPMLELDVGPTSTERLRFTVNDVPAGVTAAALVFDTFDADHPNEEGQITVNGTGPFAVPAGLGWDNVMRTDERVDVTRAVREGRNEIAFGPGPLARSFYRIGRVRLELTARTTRCGTSVPAPDGGAPMGPRVTRRVTYPNARYTNRNNFVFRCDSNYAYTARGDHAAEDCTGGYNPDGTLRGTATFVFPAVVPGTYDVVITSRHSSNRNALGALFRVNAEARRIDQRTGPGTLTLVDDLWGRVSLGGDVTVVLDSTSNRGSDSVSSVTLRPVP